MKKGIIIVAIAVVAFFVLPNRWFGRDPSSRLAAQSVARGDFQFLALVLSPLPSVKTLRAQPPAIFYFLFGYFLLAIGYWLLAISDSQPLALHSEFPLLKTTPPAPITP